MYRLGERAADQFLPSPSPSCRTGAKVTHAGAKVTTIEGLATEDTPSIRTNLSSRKPQVDRIGELLVPGSSLVVSDEGLGRETGRGTEFIVLTRCSTKITFGAFFRNTPATIMRCARTFRLARTHPARARLSGSETLLRSRSFADYTIDTRESEVFGSHTGDRSLPQ